jgi:osmotically inducible lipoprotein OsmB
MQINNGGKPMRKAILAAATFAALTLSPINASAQNAVGGAIVGAGAGAVIGGAATHSGEGAAIGAAIGATTGAAIGANADVDVRTRHRQRVCWHDDWGHRHCRWRYR